MSSSGPRSLPLRTEVLATAIGVLAALLGTWGAKAVLARARIDERAEALTRDWPLSREDRFRMGRVLEHELRPLLASPAYNRLPAGESARLQTRGRLRLSDADLAAYHELRKQQAYSSERACACLWSDRECTPDDTVPALARLSDEDLSTWYRINARSILAEVEATQAPHAEAADSAELARAVMGRLNDADRDRFLSVAGGKLTAPADRCFAVRAMFTGIDATEPARRAPIIRALMSGEAR